MGGGGGMGEGARLDVKSLDEEEICKCKGSLSTPCSISSSDACLHNESCMCMGEGRSSSSSDEESDSFIYLVTHSI